MQLLPEPGRADRKATDALHPCDRAALSCAARLKRQCPEVRLTAAVVTTSGDVLPPEDDAALPLRPAENAAAVIRNVLALGADDAVQIPVPAGSGFAVPDGAALVRMAEAFFSVSFSLILTGFHMQPLLPEETVHRMGMTFCRDVTDLGFTPDSAPDRLQVQTKDPDGFSLRPEKLPLIAEFVRSPLPSEQPAFASVAASYRYVIPVLVPDEAASAAAQDFSRAGMETADYSSRSFPLFFDAKKTAPPQIAKELLHILSDYRLLPETFISGEMPEDHPDFSSSDENSAPDVRTPEAAGEPANPLLWADRIVSVGRGAIGPGDTTQEVIRLAQRLARRLRAEVGSSKAAVDLGLFPASRQVGKTSSIAAPDLYVACGISGSIQHQDGMRKSRFIVAVNNDPDAPIFRIADVCICGDVRGILQALTDEPGDISLDSSQNSSGDDM